MDTTGLKICLVDDDRIYQFAARKIIEATGLAKKVMVFSNGREALAHFQNQPGEEIELPDVIFLDINMPVMNGWQFLDAFKAISPKLAKPITIYMVSSSVDEYDLNRSRNYEEVADYIIKPVHREKFKEVLADVNCA
jgi:CheY-like chemotaxis protein